MTTSPDPRRPTHPDPITWWACEPRRLKRDQREITAAFPDLLYDGEGAGSWHGTLPLWPFDRPQPPYLTDWMGTTGLRVAMAFPQAYPMVPPHIFPLDPVPELAEWTQSRWHVNGDGTLCLLRAHALWTGRESVVDLLLKAAAWRVEYALMKHGAISQMSDCGIVEDDCFDHFLTQPPPTMAAADNILTAPHDTAPDHQDAGSEPLC
ncbi:hypothetical protein AB0D12_34395 [Streptomyces sp. NPDC048479]|uniref:ubiquitin-conjugating enzyme E2 variant n=1 Tax=Streptomyces sp. NPDC048479 TaxID=3154725 RepID=UPI003444B459